MDTVTSPEYKEQHSVISKQAWQDPFKRSRLLKSFQNREVTTISDYPKLLLFLLMRHETTINASFWKI